MKYIYCLLVLLTAAPSTLPGASFEYSPRARTAYQLTLSLRFEEARLALTQLRREEPENLIVHHIENYIDFFTIYIQEEEEVYKRLKGNRDIRLAKIEKDGDPSSPYFLFLQADIRLHWALARLKFGEYLGAFNEVNRAYKLLKKNQERFPKFMPNYKDLGILHAMVGTIPDNYKWGVKLLSGLDGTISQGRRELEQVLSYARENDFVFQQEATALYAFLLLHLDSKEEMAWQVVQQAGFNPKSNLLHCFVLANLAMRTGHNEEAIRLLQHRPRGPEYLSFPYMDLMLGLAKLRRLDRDAGAWFLRFLDQYQGQNFIKEAYQKLAWTELIHGNTNGYRQYMEACKSKGKAVTGPDDSAHKEAVDGMLPSVVLLKARLLFDGAYYDQAFQLLSNRKLADFADSRSRLEYVYRLGRVLHGQRKHEQALRYYQMAINMGRDSSYFFACNAALQAGRVCETLDQPEEAIRFFQQCLSMKPDEHRTGMHQQAKSGLARLREKAR